MNIGYLVTKSEVGGAQKWVLDQLDITNQFSVNYLITSKPGWLTRKVNEATTVVTNDGILSLFSIKYLVWLVRYVRSNNIDLLVASSANAGIYARLAGVLCRCKVIYVSHGWSAVYNGGRVAWFYIAVERFLSKISSSVLCVSVSDYNTARDIIKIRDEKLKTIVNKVLSSGKKRQSIGDADKPLNVLMVARFSHPKRQDLAIRSFQGLSDNLFLVGDGPEFDYCLNLTGGAFNIQLLGEIEGFSSFHEYDVFMLLSDSEGLPISALEAMDAGLPLLLSRVGGCVNIVEGNGVLVENSVESVRLAVNDIRNNYQAYQDRSNVLFDEKYNLSLLASEYMDYYRVVKDN
ncbi:glycosyltransferase [Saccharospirillum sp. HFRX-1]|uniref:glycosyltransferase n=1 Tax=unclassified Saccharospirillum TaxID=2633430 RepID=UPI003717023E